jgi:hypothetical protein
MTQASTEFASPAGMRVHVAVFLTAAAVLGCGKHAFKPKSGDLLAPQARRPAPAYDLFGRSLSRAEAEALLRTEAGRAQLAPAAGAVAIDDKVLADGERAFYEETFGNEVFLTEVLGMLDGPLTAREVAVAIAKLEGGGTSNLRVALAKSQVIGSRRFEKGQLIDTGLDVAKGSTTPLGMKIGLQGGHVTVGISCALCHSTVDSKSGRVIHGAPNADFNAGLLLALASNSAAFFAHTDVDPRKVHDARKMEEAVDAVLVRWPPGCFDSMTDLVANPGQLPSSFTWESYPYSFSGAFMAGPFHGLSVQNNNVHALNSDATAEADAAPARFGIDTQLFLTTVLRNAPSKRFRYDPASGKPARAFLDSVDPTPGQPGLNQMVALPTYPKSTLAEPTSLWNAVPGRTVWYDVNAMSAWQNTLLPPPAPLSVDEATRARGRAVFERAGCNKCHDGPALTNHRIIAATEVGGVGLRAKGMASTGQSWNSNAVGYAFDQPVPLPAQPRTLELPTANLDPAQVRLAYGWGDSPGGYKVPGLVGLYWTAPYLHDGSVAMGSDTTKAVGLAGTLLHGVAPDPAASLRALVDRELRARVVAANRGNADLATQHIEGTGHELWVDAGSGFSAADQEALVAYLLTYRPPN